MQVSIKTKNLRVRPNEEEMIRKKVERLSRYLDQLSEAEVVLGSEKNSRGPDRRVVQLTVRANGALLRAEEEHEELLSAFDAAVNKMERRIQRFKGRWSSRRKGVPGLAEAVAPSAEDVESEDAGDELEPPRPIVRTKRFQVRPMTREDAVEQMELLGHDFFVFWDADTKHMGVLYRRDDGDYGLIEPAR